MVELIRSTKPQNVRTTVTEYSYKILLPLIVRGSLTSRLRNSDLPMKNTAALEGRGYQEAKNQSFFCVVTKSLVLIFLNIQNLTFDNV